MNTTSEYSVYEQDGAWAVADGDGTEICAGLRDEDEALRVARRWLARRADAAPLASQVATENAKAAR